MVWSLESALVFFRVSSGSSGMFVLLKLVTGLRSRSVPVHVGQCQVFLWISGLLLSHLQSLVLQLFLLELDLLDPHCQLIDRVRCWLSLFSVRVLLECSLCVEEGCIRGLLWWFMECLRPVMRMHLLPCIYGPH